MKLAYKGYVIAEDNAGNFRVQDSKGFTAFVESAANVQTAKKWIDAYLNERLVPTDKIPRR